MTRCAKTGCTNEAKWFPVLLLYADRTRYPQGAPARGLIAMPHCDACKATTVATDLISDEGWQTIARGFAAQKKVIPSRPHTELTWTPMTSAEAQMMQRYRGH